LGNPEIRYLKYKPRAFAIQNEGAEFVCKFRTLSVAFISLFCITHESQHEESSLLVYRGQTGLV